MLADLAATFKLLWSASPFHALVVIATSLIQAVIPAASLWIAKLLLDAVAEVIEGRAGGPEQAFGRLVGLLALQVGVGAGGTLLATIHNSARELLGDSLQNRISRRILAKAASLEVERFENSETYDSLRNAYAEVGVRPLGVAMQALGLAQATITLASVGALLGRLGPEIIPLVLLAAVPGVLVSTRFGAENYRMIRYRAPDARAQNYLGQVLTSDNLVKEVRLFGFEPYLLERWNEFYRKFRSQLVPLIRRRGGWGALAALLSAGLVALATLAVLRRVVNGEITVGDFSLFALGIAQVQGQFSNLLGGLTGIYQSLLYMRNLYEFLELPARDLDAGEEWQGPIDTIELLDVSFAYPLTDRQVLRGISLKVRRGESLALVGENGAGKTTLVKLLTRLYEPTAGRILLNGVDASRFSPRSVQRQMSIVFQDFGQYHLTARENVALGALDRLRDDPAIRQAGERGGANEFIDRLPAGYDTMLGRMFAGGVQLSGGEWQRLALARLHFRPGSVLVFDEPTAALDAAAEFAVIERLRAAARDRLTVLISHRFSTVRLADRIVVLEGGVVTESGTHEDLLARDGTYAHLYTLQARGYQPAGNG
jgi:ATP-binding cassette subfamily B protein